MKKGSYTVEMAVVISVLLLILCAFFIRFNEQVGMVLSSTQVVEHYEEAFYKKIDAFLLEKVHREWR